MKREGRQHGMVGTYQILPSPWNPRPESRHVNKLDSRPTAGFFTRVSTKPTSHSKFSGKCSRPRCNRCHINPACKSKSKTKGTQKLRDPNYRLVTCRVGDAKPRLNLSGLSASRLLDHLALDYDDDFVDDESVEIETSDDDDDDDDVGFAPRVCKCRRRLVFG